MSNEPGFLAGKKREKGGEAGGERGGGNGARIQVGFVLKQAPKKKRQLV